MLEWLGLDDGSEFNPTAAVGLAPTWVADPRSGHDSLT